MDKDTSTLLQEIQAKTDWSQTRLAAEIGSSQPTVYRILSGQGDCLARTDRAISKLHAKVFPKRARNQQR